MKLLWLILELLWSLRIGGLGLLAVFVGLYVVWKKAKESHVDDDVFFEAGFGAIVWSVVAARLIYVLANMQQFGVNPVKWLWLTKFPGLDFVGGVIGLGLWLWWWTKETEWQWWVVSDWAVLGLAVVESIWSLSSWGVDPSTVVIGNFVSMFLIWLLLWNVENKYRMYAWYKGKKGQANPGLVTALFMVLVGMQRLVTGVWVDNGWWWWNGLMVATGIMVLFLRMGKFEHLVIKKGISVRWLYGKK